MKPQTISSKVVQRTNGDSEKRSHNKVSARSRSPSNSSSSEEDVKIHSKKTNNGFHRPHSNTHEESAHHEKLTQIALDVKSDEAKQRGDFKNFDLPKDLVEKLKGFLKHNHSK